MDYRFLIYKYYEEHNILENLIESYNNFVDYEMNKILKEIGEKSPKLLPPGVKELKFRFERITLSKADYVEKEGISRVIYPSEARLRNITYSGPLHLEFYVIKDDREEGPYTTSIGRFPIMVRSKYCNTYGLSEEELIKVGEDPSDPGGYFIINGTEYVLVFSEELSTNRLYVQKEEGSYKVAGFLMAEDYLNYIPHRIELRKDGILFVSFERYKRIPLIPLIKALGIERDDLIANTINENDNFEEVLINLMEYVDIKNQEEAVQWLADKLKLTGSPEVKREKLFGILDSKLLPNIGKDPASRILKAYNLLKAARKVLLLNHDLIGEDDKDHLANKVIRSPGDLLSEYFAYLLRYIIDDAMYQFDRLLRRGKIPNYTTIFRGKLLTERINLAMSTGKWRRNKVGVSQVLDRTNKLSVMSHLTRVWSSIMEEAELLEARMVHGSHWGRLDPIETPEGKTTGLRKNLTLLSRISNKRIDREEFIRLLENLGLKVAHKNIYSK